MEKNTKYVYLLLKERNGEFEYSHRSIHELQDSKKITAKKFVKNYLKGFYGSNAESDAEGYYFYNGEVFVEVYTWKFISEDEFKVLKKYI